MSLFVSRYVRKHEFVDDEFNTIYTIIVWRWDRWIDFFAYHSLSESTRDLMLQDMIDNGAKEFEGIKVEARYVNKESPDMMDIQVEFEL